MTGHRPSGHTRAHLALVLCMVVGLTLLIVVATGSDHRPPDESSPYWLALGGTVYQVLGYLLVTRRPTLVVPWLLVAFGLCLTASAALVSREIEATGRWADLDAVLYATFVALIALIAQVYPTGRPLDGSWQWLTWSLAGGWALIVLGQALDISLDNTSPLWLALPGLGAGVLFFGGLLGTVPMLVVRFHRARGAERAQLKWLLFSVALGLVGWFLPENVLGTPDRLVVNLASLLPALAITVGLLRYHLYDIDRVISRTTSYAIVSGLVLAVYLLVVALTTRLLPNAGGLPVAVGTLAAAAVFRPGLRRVQDAVDRRFNRARFDARRTLDVFASRLQQVVDDETVSRDLTAVVRGSLMPATVTVWLPTR